MAITINTSVWGAPETWVQVGATGAAGKVPDFPYIDSYQYADEVGTLVGGYINGDIDLTEIDESICPWAIGKDADFLKGKIWLINPDGSDELEPEHLNPVLQDFNFYDVAPRAAFPFFLGRNTHRSRRYYHRAIDSLESIQAAASASDWLSVSPTPIAQGNYATAPFLNFNYNKLLCVPYAIFLTENTKTVLDGKFPNGYRALAHNDAEYACTSYCIDDITDELLDDYYCVGICFKLYGEKPNPGDSNDYSYYTYGIIEKNPFPPMETVTGGTFGSQNHFPITIIGESSSQDNYGTIIGCQTYFPGLQTGSSNDEVYTAGNFCNKPTLDYCQPKVFPGGDNWSYYGYYSTHGNFYTVWDGNYCNPIFTWNGGNAAALKAYIMEQAAYLGFIFTDSDSSSVWNKKGGWDGTGANEYLPIFDANGYTTGRYVHGSAAADEPNYDWGSDVWEKTNYTGTPPIDEDPNEYDEDNKTILNIDYQKRKFKFCKGYLLTEQNVMDLSAEVYNIGTTIGAASDIIKEMLEKLFLKDGDPMDIIVSLMFFPFNPAKILIVPPDVEEIMFGAFPTGINAQRWDRELCIIDMGSASLFPHMGDTIDDFRNYAPYTTAELQLPYIGNVDVDPHIFLGHTISVKYVVDLSTGAVQALIYRDQLVIDQASGQIGTFIPVRGVDQLEQLTAQQHAAAAYKQARNTQIGSFARFGLSIAAGAAAVLTGGAALAAGAGALAASGLQQLNNEESVNRAEYDLQHIATPFRETGHASSITAYSGEQQVRLIIKRPRMAADYNPQQYGHSIGFATVQTGQIGSFSGFTICSKINLDGIQATSSELKAIQKALQSGVFI